MPLCLDRPDFPGVSAVELAIANAWEAYSGSCYWARSIKCLSDPDRGSHEVKHTWDGIMASFTSVTQAVQCALAIQKRVGERNADAADALRLRVGVSCGEPVTEEGDLFGAAVELAARLCGHGDAGGILVSSAVREVCLGKGFEFDDRGSAELKGFDEPIRLYGVRAPATRAGGP